MGSTDSAPALINGHWLCPDALIAIAWRPAPVAAPAGCFLPLADCSGYLRVITALRFVIQSAPEKVLTNGSGNAEFHHDWRGRPHDDRWGWGLTPPPAEIVPETRPALR